MSRRIWPLVAVALWTCSEPQLTADAPVILADAGAGNPTAAAADDGSSFIAWIGTRDSVSDVFVARIDDGVPGAPVRVNDVEGDAAPHEQAPPQVAVAPDGSVYVVWQNNLHVPGRRFPASNLRFARSTDGGRTFEPATFVNDDAEGLPSSHTFQDLRVSEDGTIFVSWIDGRERARAEAAGAADRAPAGHGAHGAGTMPGSQVRVAKSTDGGRTFTAGVVVHDNVCPCCRTALALSGNRVAVSFRSAEQNIRDIVVVMSSDHGETWGAPVRVHEDGWQVDACPHAGAALAFGADGRLHVAWYTGAEERQGLWYARTTAAGGAFEAPVPLQTGGWVPVSQVKLAADGQGDLWIAWDDRREAEPVVKLAVARDGRLRKHPLGVSGRSPAISAGGTVVLAWQDGDRAAAQVVRRP